MPGSTQAPRKPLSHLRSKENSDEPSTMGAPSPSPGDNPAVSEKLAGVATEVSKPANIFGANSIRAATTGAGAGCGIRHDVDHNIEMIAVDLAKPCKANARTHSREQIRQIADCISSFGFCNPILIDDENQIIAGHGRLAAAKLLGLKTVPALRLSHLSDAEKRAYTLADNRTAELAEWDLDILANELGDLLDLGFEVELTGFDLDDIQHILDIPDEDPAAKDAVEHDGAKGEIAEPCSRVSVSRPGDEWLLGEHRLICGNASDDRAYVAVDGAVRYWQILVGSSATLAGTSKTFAEIEEERNGPRDGGPDQSVLATREAA